MLWFVFWQDIVKGGGEPGGVLSMGVGTALLGLAIAALLCHFLVLPGAGQIGHANRIAPVRGGNFDLRSDRRADHARVFNGIAAIRLAGCKCHGGLDIVLRLS